MELASQFYWSFLVGAVLAALIVWLLVRRQLRANRARLADIHARADREAELKVREIISRDKIAFEEQKARQTQQLRARESKIGAEQESLLRRETDLKEQEARIEEEKAVLERTEGELHRRRQNVDNLRQLYRRRLIQIANLTESEAKAALFQEIRTSCATEIQDMRTELMERSQEEIEDEARRVLINSMQRLAGACTTDISASFVKLPSDDIKGRLIGKEGRNIKMFETLTGTSLVIDETPETVTVSSFDPVRREVAKLALEELVADGRIHPPRIEAAVAHAREKLSEQIEKYATEALERLKIEGVASEVRELVGRLHFRLSNNQNALDHSIEVAFLCSMLASELGMDPDIARRCGLFHDIGKAIEGEQQSSHAGAGAKILEAAGEDSRVVNATAAHHNEVPQESVYAALLIIADSVSALRPGARADSMEGYLKRVKALEDIGNAVEGVEDCYVLQAGRELRVVICPEHHDDDAASRVARTIRERVEAAPECSGAVKIIVVREKRFIETTK